MCLNLIYTSGDVPRLCHRCWQCRRDRVNDWVGRCIAEWKTSQHCLVGTLTYGQDPRYEGADHVHAHVLFYSDVQKWLKRIRKATAGKIRFFCAGEYGSKKGRAHWHVLLFCQGELPPNVRYRERYVHNSQVGRALWPHGWTYWDDPTAESIRYVAKYVLKDFDKKWQGMHRASTVPELGHEYFRQLAEIAVEQQLPPTLRYRFPLDVDHRGLLNEYRLSRAAAFKYLRWYDKYWQERYGNRDWPESELMDIYCDEVLRRELIESGENLIDFYERWELESAERRRRWIYALREGEQKAKPLVSFYPSPVGHRYSLASRGG